MSSEDFEVTSPSAPQREAGVAANLDATELLEIVSSRAADFSRKAADDLYVTLLEATQDYLIDNARFNIGERIACAERQARHDREAWGKAESRLTAQKATTADLLEALKALYHKTIIGTDDERHAALDAAWRAIAKAEGRS